MQLPECLTKDASGSIRLTGHRIGLEHFVYFYNQGYSPEMLLGQFPTLSLALIHKLIAFYLENQPSVDSYAANCQGEIDRERAGNVTAPDVEELRRRLAALSKTSTP
jgi:uncharacterized protein (DUF433 family)